MLVKTHLIVNEQYEDKWVKWVRKIIDLNPVFDSNNRLQFIITTSRGRHEITTTNLVELEKIAKNLTCPHGRKAVEREQGYIYIKEKNKETLIGIIEHYRIKKFAPMYDEIGD